MCPLGLHNRWRCAPPARYSVVTPRLRQTCLGPVRGGQAEQRFRGGRRRTWYHVLTYLFRRNAAANDKTPLASPPVPIRVFPWVRVNSMSVQEINCNSSHELKNAHNVPWRFSASVHFPDWLNCNGEIQLTPTLMYSIRATCMLCCGQTFKRSISTFIILFSFKKSYTNCRQEEGRGREIHKLKKRRIER